VVLPLELFDEVVGKRNPQLVRVEKAHDGNSVEMGCSRELNIRRRARRKAGRRSLEVGDSAIGICFPLTFPVHDSVPQGDRELEKLDTLVGCGRVRNRLRLKGDDASWETWELDASVSDFDKHIGRRTDMTVRIAHSHRRETVEVDNSTVDES
jgi:hypothetical protein